MSHQPVQIDVEAEDPTVDSYLREYVAEGGRQLLVRSVSVDDDDSVTFELVSEPDEIQKEINEDIAQEEAKARAFEEAKARHLFDFAMLGGLDSHGRSFLHELLERERHGEPIEQ